MANKRSKSPSNSRRKTPKSNIGLSEPQSLTLTSPVLPNKKWLPALTVAALAIILTVVMMKHRGPGGAAAAVAQAHPAWGPSVKLELAGQFKIPVEQEIEAIQADAQG